MLATTELIEILLEAKNFSDFQSRAKAALLRELEGTHLMLVLSGADPAIIEDAEKQITRLRAL